MTGALTAYEQEILDCLPFTWTRRDVEVPHWLSDTRTEGEKAAAWTAARYDTPTALVVWTDKHGTQVGVARSRIPASINAGVDAVEASPFAGAWTRVPVAAILTVRKPQAL